MNQQIKKLNFLEINNILNVNELIFLFDIDLSKNIDSLNNESISFIFKLACILNNFEIAKKISNINYSTYIHTLHRLCYYNNIKAIDTILNYFNINISTNELNKLFVTSCKYNNNECIEYIYNLHPDINFNNSESFNFICKNGNLEIAKLLYNFVNSDNKCDFILSASKNDNIEFMDWLITNFQYEDYYLAFDTSCLFGNIKIAKKLYSLVKINNFDKNSFIEKIKNEIKDSKLCRNNNLIEWLYDA